MRKIEESSLTCAPTV